MANFTNNTAQLQDLLTRVQNLPSENEYLDEINFINGNGTETTMANAVGKTETLVASEADVIAEIVTALAGKANPSAEIFTTTASVTSNSQQISFTGLPWKPKTFTVIPLSNITLSTSNRFVVNVGYLNDDTVENATFGVYCYGSSSGWSSSYTAAFSYSYFTTTYSDGTLTIKTESATNGGYFAANVEYELTAVF